MLPSWQSFQRCCWSVFWHQRGARWASVVTTGPNMTKMRPRGDWEITPHPAKVSPSTTRVPPSVKKSPPMIIMAKFLCNGNDHWEATDIWLWAWAAGKSGVDTRRVHRKTNCLGADRSDGCRESNPSCQTITKVPSVYRTKAVFMMGIDKMRQGSLEPQYHIEGSAGSPGISSRVTSNFLVAIT